MTTITISNNPTCFKVESFVMPFIPPQSHQFCIRVSVTEFKGIYDHCMALPLGSPKVVNNAIISAMALLHIDFSGITFSGCVFYDVDFTGSTFNGVTFKVHFALTE